MASRPRRHQSALPGVFDAPKGAGGPFREAPIAVLALAVAGAGFLAGMAAELVLLWRALP